MKKTSDVVAFALGIEFLLVLVGHVSASSNSTIYSFGTTQPLDGAKRIANLRERFDVWAHDHSHTRMR